MRLLFDQNLSPKLAHCMSDLFPESMHVRQFGYQRAPDASVWELALENGYVIVTKDADFADRSAAIGFPPKVVWFKRGNCSTDDIEVILRHRCRDIERFGDDPKTGLLVIR